MQNRVTQVFSHHFSFYVDVNIVFDTQVHYLYITWEKVHMLLSVCVS